MKHTALEYKASSLSNFNVFAPQLARLIPKSWDLNFDLIFEAPPTSPPPPRLKKYFPFESISLQYHPSENINKSRINHNDLRKRTKAEGLENKKKSRPTGWFSLGEAEEEIIARRRLISYGFYETRQLTAKMKFTRRAVKYARIFTATNFPAQKLTRGSKGG